MNRFDRVERTAVVVLGSGAAGLATALAAPGPVRLITKTRLGDGSSRWAQGGVAVALGEGDSPRLHAADTLAVAGGIAVPSVVEALALEGPARVRRLIALGAEFDRGSDGELALGREAAHSRRRIVHAQGDATGREIVRALLAAVRGCPHVTVEEEVFAVDLALRDGRVVGVVARGPRGERILSLAGAVVLATGGLGQLYAATTNPREATADGVAMAARAGARLVDLEFVQFHPTALDVAGGGQLPLLTEALRGEGAVLVDETGTRFMTTVHADAELAPRDVVARAIWRHRRAGHRTFLDARGAVGERFPGRFPTVFAACMERGIDPRTEAIPVRPAAHYAMGGVAVEAHGRTSLPGLWACGEVAATGVHGANRLASNSLLEALVFGARVGEDLQRLDVEIPSLPVTLPSSTPTVPAAAGGAAVAEQRAAIQRIMEERVGVERDGAALRGAVRQLEALGRAVPPASEEANLALAARLVATAAWLRRESRGGHFRSDFPETVAAWRRRLVLHLGADGTIREESAAPSAVADLVRHLAHEVLSPDGGAGTADAHLVVAR